MKDISLYSSTDLIEELQSRYDNFIVIGYRDKNDKGDYDIEIRYKGDYYPILGLLEETKNNLLDKMKVKEV